ncbi:MAG: hypothetical protein AAFO07_25485, partial [Bacteroidota bacterium]
MGIIIKSKRHVYIRIPIILTLIGIFAISPLLISFVGSWLVEMTTNEPCHEGNCYWAAFGWMVLLSFPTAVFLFVIFIVIVILDIR